MAELTFISETGMFHSVVRCVFADSTVWRGFKPIRKSAPMGRGYVDTDDHSDLINHYITFAVEDERLGVTIEKVTNAYKFAYYVLAVRDCVSFTSDIAEGVFLKIPPRPISLPYDLILGLAMLNPGYTAKG